MYHLDGLGKPSYNGNAARTSNALWPTGTEVRWHAPTFAVAYADQVQSDAGGFKGCQ